jgi:hypothetical protein
MVVLAIFTANLLTAGLLMALAFSARVLIACVITAGALMACVWFDAICNETVGSCSRLDMRAKTAHKQERCFSCSPIQVSLHKIEQSNSKTATLPSSATIATAPVTIAPLLLDCRCQGRIDFRQGKIKKQ